MRALRRRCWWLIDVALVVPGVVALWIWLLYWYELGPWRSAFLWVPLFLSPPVLCLVWKKPWQEPRLFGRVVEAQIQVEVTSLTRGLAPRQDTRLLDQERSGQPRAEEVSHAVKV